MEFFFSLRISVRKQFYYLLGFPSGNATIFCVCSAEFLDLLDAFYHSQNLVTILCNHSNEPQIRAVEHSVVLCFANALRTTHTMRVDKNNTIIAYEDKITDAIQVRINFICFFLSQTELKSFCNALTLIRFALNIFFNQAWLWTLELFWDFTCFFLCEHSCKINEL